MWVAFFLPRVVAPEHLTLQTISPLFLSRLSSRALLSVSQILQNRIEPSHRFDSELHPSQVAACSTDLTLCQRDAYYFRSVLIQD
jgi:hypothetical protein